MEDHDSFTKRYEELEKQNFSDGERIKLIAGLEASEENLNNLLLHG